MKKAAVFCHNGLGDAIIAFVLSNNFHLNGWQVDTFHNGIQSLQSWFPHLPAIPYPDENEVENLIEKYDALIVFHNDTSDFIQKMMEIGKRKSPEKVKIIYPYPTTGIRLRPHYQDSLLDPTKSIIEGLAKFCDEIMGFQKTTKSNGIIAPLHLKFRKNEKRVVLHVASSRPGKNWPIQKFVKLALHLKKKGYSPVFIAGGAKEREAYLWLEKEGFELPLFSTLDQVAQFLYESGYLIGNDSGLGHLASSLGVPTVTISRRKALARFWRPKWAPGRIVVPHFLIPNISGLRLRDRKWQKFISVGKVARNFKKLVSASHI